MTQYITRAYNSFTFDHKAGIIKKYSKEQRLAQEAEYYKNIPPSLSIYFPRLISAGFDDQTSQNFLELELYPYENLGKLLVGQKLSDQQWQEIAAHIAEILGEFKKHNLSQKFAEDMSSMYIDKTEREYKNLVEGFPVFRDISQQKTIVVNGKQYENFEVIWPKIKDKFLTKLLDEKLTPSVIHGDFCFSNILAGFLPDGKTILRFVDPRGKFGNLSVYGDPYYDLAKLMHSTDVGYEYFIYDQFQVSKQDDGSFSLYYTNPGKESVNDIFFKELYSKYDPARIKLIEATIYIGMCARHYDSEQRQLVMYLSGVRLLNELLKD